MVKKIYKASKLACDGGGEIAEIRRVIKTLSILIEFQYEKVDRKCKPTIQELTNQWIVGECYKRAKEEREKIQDKNNMMNMKFEGRFTIKKDNIIKTGAVKQAIREIDAQRCEKAYAKSRLRNNYDIFDIKARNAFTKTRVTTAMIKCAHGINPYGIRMDMINKKEYGNECPRCSEDETWEHVIKCRKTINIRKEFIKTLVKEMSEKCPTDIDQDEILSLIEDILKYLESDDSDEYETNQGIIGI